MLKELADVLPPQYLLIVLICGVCVYAAIKALGDKNPVKIDPVSTGTPHWVLLPPTSDMMQAIHDINENLKALVELQKRVETSVTKIATETDLNRRIQENTMNQILMITRRES